MIKTLAKNLWLGARVDKAFHRKVTGYIKSVPELTLAMLLRRAIVEYMDNHPIKDPEVKVDAGKNAKPGE